MMTFLKLWKHITKQIVQLDATPVLSFWRIHEWKVPYRELKCLLITNSIRTDRLQITTKRNYRQKYRNSIKIHNKELKYKGKERMKWKWFKIQIQISKWNWREKKIKNALCNRTLSFHFQAHLTPLHSWAHLGLWLCHVCKFLCDEKRSVCTAHMLSWKKFQKRRFSIFFLFIMTIVNHSWQIVPKTTNDNQNYISLRLEWWNFQNSVLLSNFFYFWFVIREW